MTTPDQAAAQIRMMMPTVEHAMAIIGMQPPEEWQRLKELVAAPPSDLLAKTAQGWTEVRSLMDESGTEFDHQSAAVPTVWDSPASAVTTASLAALSRQHEMLSASCDDATTNLLNVLKAGAHLVLNSAGILLGAAAGGLFIHAAFWAAPWAFTALAIADIIVTIVLIKHQWNVFETTIRDQCHNLDALTTKLGGPSAHPA